MVTWLSYRNLMPKKRKKVSPVSPVSVTSVTSECHQCHQWVSPVSPVGVNNIARNQSYKHRIEFVWLRINLDCVWRLSRTFWYPQLQYFQDWCEKCHQCLHWWHWWHSLVTLVTLFFVFSASDFGRITMSPLKKIKSLQNRGSTSRSVSYTHLTLPTNREV